MKIVRVGVSGAIAALMGVAVGVGAGAAQAKVSLPVVVGAQSISVAEKSGANGECGCVPEASKPGYGFGAKVQHYGPPGQGFNPYWTWRHQKQLSNYTPKGNPLPPRAFK
jgi:hypothetical protein